MPNGTWFKNGIHEYTDYSLCSMESYHSFLYFWELAVHSASILVLLPALVVLLSYRSLQKPWFHMLLNFYIALLLRSLMTIIELSVIKIPENKHISTIMEDNGVGCKIVASLRLASLLSVWVWMLANSVFLYRSVARALSRTTNIKIYYFTAWGCTVLLTAVWVTCKALLEDYQCWLGDVKEDRYKLYLIKDIPIILSLAISLGLLSHLACLVFSNMRGRSESIKEDNKKAFKATVFLVPMFGLQFFLSVVVYTEVECTRLQVNLCFATALTGLQGLYASVIYCFMNAEVKRELQKTLNSLAARLCPRRDEAMYPQSSVGPQTTYSTVQADTQADTSPVETTELVALNSNMQTTR
ncbi:GPCR family 2 secretin-like [Trinorchestia longiramus]|nr:GPCR family 2 secretin-like [Trinorchestia longiramus]